MAITGGELNMDRLDGKWELTEEVNKPNIFIGVPHLRAYLIAPRRLKKEKLFLQR